MNSDDALARLKAADWLHSQPTQELLRALDGAGGRTRVVGGIVRDTLLGLPRADADIDLATELTPDDVGRRAEEVGAVVHPTGIGHGTVTVRLGPLVSEVTTLREDVETDGRRAVVRFGRDWARDAGRRDFTLNALYAGMDGELFDPLGGLEDCLAARVRFIGDPIQRIDEDRLRVYRFFRFSASHAGQRFDPEGLAACAAYAGRLSAVSAERVGGEFKRMLGLPRVALALATMAGAGIADFTDTETRRLSAYEVTSPHPCFADRLAILLVGRNADDLQDTWRLSKEDLRTATDTLSAARLLAAARVNEATYRHGTRVRSAIDVAGALEEREVVEIAALRRQIDSLVVPAFPITGNDLVATGMRPGPDLGAELHRLEQIWIENGFAPGREELLALANVG